LVNLLHLHAGVILLKNLCEGVAVARQPVSADLAHADAMSPAAPREDKCREATARVVFAVDDEEVFFQAERAAQLRTAQPRGAVVTGDFDFNHAIRIGELRRRDAFKLPDIDTRARQPPLHLFSADALLPLRD